MTRRRRRRLPSSRLVAVVILTGAVCAVGVALGVTAPFVVAVTVLTAAAGGAWLGLRPHDADPARLDRAGARPGTRSDVAWLTWALSAPTRGLGGRVLEGQALERTRAAIRGRLVRRGLDPDAVAPPPALEGLVDPAVWRFVSGAAGRVTLGTVEQCLDALDRLDALEDPRGARR